MLQPIAIEIIIQQGYGSLLSQGRQRGVFCCGLNYIRLIMRERGWRCVRPQGDTRKLPDDWAAKRWLMVLRLAYFVFVHEIPKSLVINADHTGIMFTQVKGRMWITKDQAKAGDKSVKGHGGKRQFTLLASTSASGETLPHQAVVQGKTAACLPKWGIHYSTSLAAMPMNSKCVMSACFVLASAVSNVANVASFCTTANHWSDNVTSKAYMKDIAVPYSTFVVRSTSFVP